MKNLNTKSIMIIIIFLASSSTMPMVAMGQVNDNGDIFNIDQVDIGIFERFKGGFGAIFSDYLGYGGSLLGSIFEILFLQGLNLTKYEMLGSVFVLSANRTHYERGTYNFDDESDTRDVYIANPDYVNMDEVGILTNMTSEEMGTAYCVVEKHGEFDYTVEVGAAVTLIIWDYDRSFITAANKLLNFFNRTLFYQLEGRELNKEIIREGISLITWFLIHINDIFTGDELFILNPITWQKLDIMPNTEPGKEFNITKNWYITGNDLSPLNDELIETGVTNGSLLLDLWNITAQNRKDSYMEWFLTPTQGQVAEAIWTQFSFDLIQLWIKNFEIHVDVAAILNVVSGGGEGSPESIIARAFEGCNIDFYLFTHHLAGAFLYNDTDLSQDISVFYTPTYTAQVPFSTELTHRLVLGQIYGGFRFDEPEIDPSTKSISWGINIFNSEVSAVPIGVDLNSYLDTPKENLDYIHFGFTFEPKINSTLGASEGLVKLNQFFSPWNDPDNSYANAEILNLDLAIIYVSAVLHFELDIKTQQQALDNPPQVPPELLQEGHYRGTQHRLMIGDYIGAAASDELEFVDIAGPDYEYGNESSRLTAPASTSIIPIEVWLMEHERHDSFTIANGEELINFASSIRIRTDLSVMVYAVCYPQFEDGCGIWHDPTFTVYMVFEGEEFWALIVLIAGVGLVGVATILIKRRKDQRF